LRLRLLFINFAVERKQSLNQFCCDQLHLFFFHFQLICNFVDDDSRFFQLGLAFLHLFLAGCVGKFELAAPAASIVKAAQTKAGCIRILVVGVHRLHLGRAVALLEGFGVREVFQPGVLSLKVHHVVDRGF